MDDKYNVRKPKKPETKQEAIQQQIEELVSDGENTERDHDAGCAVGKAEVVRSEK